MENTQTSNKKYAIIAIISVVVLLALFAAGYFLVRYYKGKSAPAPSEIKKPKVVTGTMLVSLLPKTIQDGSPLTVSIDASTSAMTFVYSDVMQGDKLYITQSSLSPNKKFYVTGGMPVDENASDAGNSLNLYSGKFGGFFYGIKPENIVAKFGTAKDAIGLSFRTPSVGDHGGILYSASPKGVREINFNWEIHYNAMGQDAVVAYGLSPKWVSPSEFVYITKKAIRMHNLTTGQDTTVDVLVDKKGKTFPIQENMSLGVSRDGKQLAFTNPESANVYLFTRDGDRFILRKTFIAFGFWPTFSPDGKILALQSVADAQNIKSNPNPRINFYDIEAEAPTILEKYINLGEFRNDLLFINDWY